MIRESIRGCGLLRVAEGEDVEVEEQVSVEGKGSNLRGIQVAITIAGMGYQEHHGQAQRWRRVLQLLGSGATPEEIRRLSNLALLATELVQLGWPSASVADMLATCDIEDLCSVDNVVPIRGFTVAHEYAADHYKNKAYWASQAMDVEGKHE